MLTLQTVHHMCYIPGSNIFMFCMCFSFCTTKFLCFCGFQPSAKLYTHDNLDWALVEWWNMAVHKNKHAKIAKSQDLWKKFHPMKIESYAVFINAKSYTYRYTCIVYICATLCQRSVPIQPVKYCWLNADSSFADLIRSPRIMTSCDGGVTYASDGHKARWASKACIPSCWMYIKRYTYMCTLHGVLMQHCIWWAPY